jgi:hypothetical protein
MRSRLMGLCLGLATTPALAFSSHATGYAVAILPSLAGGVTANLQPSTTLEKSLGILG